MGYEPEPYEAPEPEPYEAPEPEPYEPEPSEPEPYPPDYKWDSPEPEPWEPAPWSNWVAPRPGFREVQEGSYSQYREYVEQQEVQQKIARDQEQQRVRQQWDAVRQQQEAQQKRVAQEQKEARREEARQKKAARVLDGQRILDAWQKDRQQRKEAREQSLLKRETEDREHQAPRREDEEEAREQSLLKRETEDREHQGRHREDHEGWVRENARMSERARIYQASAPGARSQIGDKASMAPELKYEKEKFGVFRVNGRVRFDGIDEEGVYVDRKLSVPNFRSKAWNQAFRQSIALTENGRRGRWEVPDEANRKLAAEMLEAMDIYNIEVSVVPEQEMP